MYADGSQQRRGRGGRWNQWTRGQSRDSYAPGTSGRENGYNQGDQNGYYYNQGDRYREDVSRGGRYTQGRSSRGGQRSWGPGRAARGRTGGRGRAMEPPDIQFLGICHGHTQKITCMVLDPASGQLFTGSVDGKVLAWKCSDPAAARPQWEQAGSYDMACPVDSLLFESGFLFVGMHAPGQGAPLTRPGCIKVWNTTSNAHHQLEGFQGQPLALAAANGMLMSGGQDAAVRWWRFDEASAQFQHLAATGQENGGHSHAVSTLVPANPFLVSADFVGTIKVWDMASGSCVQTLEGAHSSTILDMLAWEGHLISCALDGCIKVWTTADTPAPGAVLDSSPAYTHTQDGLHGKPAGLLKLAGAVDGAQVPVILSSANGEGTIYLWELPSFLERGQLRAHDPRALIAAPGGMVLAGESNGDLKIWRWKPASMPLG